MTCIPKNAWKRKDAVDGLQGLNLELLAGTQICFPGDPVVKNPLPMQDTSRGFDPWVKKIPWRRKWQPTCLGNPMDRGAWWATVHRSQRVRHDFGAKQQHRFAKALAVKLCSDRTKLRTFSCVFLHSLSHNVSGAPRHRVYSHMVRGLGLSCPGHVGLRLPYSEGGLSAPFSDAQTSYSVSAGSSVSPNTGPVLSWISGQSWMEAGSTSAR